jgi:hypothetical protein
MDFPFGLPVEVMEPGAGWARQFRFLREYKHDAYAAGLECVRRAQEQGKPMHIRRATDAENKAPFDSYHYRIIYQTFHGMWDVLRPLLRDRETAILPFHEHRVVSAKRVLVEACPASTLKRMGLPFQNYKEPGGGDTRREASTPPLGHPGRTRAVRDDQQGATPNHHGEWRRGRTGRDHRGDRRGGRDEADTATISGHRRCDVPSRGTGTKKPIPFRRKTVHLKPRNNAEVRDDLIKSSRTSAYSRLFPLAQ